MIGSNTTLIYAEPSTIVSHNVNMMPLHEDGDTDDSEDVPRTIYVWPHRYDPSARQVRDVGTEASQQLATQAREFGDGVSPNDSQKPAEPIEIPQSLRGIGGNPGEQRQNLGRRRRP
jgi:hypothetical protein